VEVPTPTGASSGTAEETALGGLPSFEAMPLRDDNPSRVDLLGFVDIVSAVESTVTRKDLDPITVGINAPWGGGKTTVLQLLQARLSSRDDVLVVYVSPWEFDPTTDTKATLIGAVLGRLETEIKGTQTALEAVKGRFKELRSRVNLTNAIKLTARTAITMSIPSINDLTSLFDPAEGTDPTLQGFRDQFATLLAEEALSHIGQVVVLVDDLDRSLPDTVVDTLEAIKLFLSVDKMAFVIAADEENVERAIGQRLQTTGQPTTARQYLEKIVHIPFRIPALSRERSEEYLCLLLLHGVDEIDPLVFRLAETRGSGHSLSARLEGLVPNGRGPDVELAERLAPILHRHTLGNPRRLKRFLNALWLRTAFARARGVELSPDACAKLMVVELLYPDLFAQMLGWLASGSLDDNVTNIESGDAEQPEQILEWGRLEPSLADVDLPAYLLLAASLRGDTIEEAALSASLRGLANRLAEDSTAVRDGALQEAATLDVPDRSILARHLSMQLRHQRSAERQKALAESISGLCGDSSVAATAAQELALMDPGSVLPPVPFSLLAKHQPAELVDVVRRWSTDEQVNDVTIRAALEALKES
jgi:hypothetical protein